MKLSRTGRWNLNGTVLGHVACVALVLNGCAGFKSESAPIAPKSVQPPGNEAEGYRLTIVAKDRYDPGEPVLVTVRVTNVGQNSGTIPVSSSRFLQHQLVLLSPSGDKAPETRYGHNALHPTIGSSQNYVLNPGESFDWEVNVSRLFDMTVEGQYTLTVKRSVFPRHGQGLVRLESSRVIIVASSKPGVRA